ncbi:MAG: porin family protein [Thermonemataceae bacterium]
MKRFGLLFFIFVVMVGFQAQAQDVRLGVRGGLNFADENGEAGGNDYGDETDLRTAFQVGLLAQFGVSDPFYLQTGLLLSSKGRTRDFGSVETTNSPLYLDIPVSLVFKGDLGGITAFGLVGPYFGFGIGGQFESEDGGTRVSRDIEWGNEEGEDNYRSVDVGIDVGIGVEIDPLQIGLNYGFALTNSRPGGDDNNSRFSRVLSLYVTYFFN